MAYDKVVDSVQLDSDLTSIANDIREKGETNAELAFPSGFKSAINALTVLHEYSGNPINFSTASTRNIRHMSVQIKPQQNLNGYTNPWPSAGGVNKLAACTPGTYTSTHATATVSSDGTIHLVGTGASSAEEIRVPLLEESIVPTDQCYLYWFNNATNSSIAPTIELSSDAGNTGIAPTLATLNRVYTINSNRFGVHVNRIRIYINTQSDYDITFHPMIALNNTETSWSPYSNVCPISGWDEVNLNCTGKNLSNKIGTVPHQQDTELWIFLKAGNYIATIGSCDQTKWRWVIYAKKTLSSSYYPYLVSADDMYVAGGTVWFSNGQNTRLYQKFTVLEDCYVQISVSYGSGSTIYPVITNPMISTGSTVTNYEAYAGTSVTIDLDGTRYGGTLDVVTGVLTVDYTGGVLDGSEGWQRGSGATWFYHGVSGTYRTGASAAYTSHFKSVYNQVNAAWMIYGQIHVYPNTTIVPSGNTDAGLAEFKAWLAQNNVDFYTKLVTPLAIQLTPQQVTTLVGTNNVWANTGDVSLEYVI